jgi:Rod binding domain-containing protein
MDALSSPVDTASVLDRANAPRGIRLPHGGDPASVRKAADDCEAMFLSQMFSHMFDSVEVDPLFGGGHGEQMFRSMLVNEYGKGIVKAGGLGISEQLQRDMLRLQEVQA